MDQTTDPTLVVLLRSTLHLVKYYGDGDAHHADLAELIAELQRAIAAIEAKEARRKSTGSPPGFSNLH